MLMKVFFRLMIMTLLSLAIFACNRFPGGNDDVTPPDNNGDTLQTDSLAGVWRLNNIEKPIDTSDYQGYDSTKCIDGTPYGFKDGQREELEGRTPEDTLPFSEYIPVKEFWGFMENDSMRAKRRGYEPVDVGCINGEIEYVAFPGHRTHRYRGTWDLSGNNLSIYIEEDASSYNYTVEVLTDNVLQLSPAGTDSTLVFNRAHGIFD